jgi:hypothetical protein
MNHCYHSINGLKGAAVPAPTISFPQSELSILTESLKTAGFYITRNPQQFQQPQEMLQKIKQGINIISSRTNNRTKTNNTNRTNTRLATTATAAKATKGASNPNNSNNNNVCSDKKKEHLKDLLKMFRL